MKETTVVSILILAIATVIMSIVLSTWYYELVTHRAFIDNGYEQRIDRDGSGYPRYIWVKTGGDLESIQE